MVGNTLPIMLFVNAVGAYVTVLNFLRGGNTCDKKA